MSLNDLLGDSLSSLGLKQQAKQSLGQMKTNPAPRATGGFGTPGGGAFPMSGAGTPGPAATPLGSLDPFAGFASPAPPPRAAPAAPATPVAGGLDDLMFGLNVQPARNATPAVSRAPPPQPSGLDSFDFLGDTTSRAKPQPGPAAASPGADFFGAPAARAVPAAAAPTAASSGGLDEFAFFAGGATPPAPPPKPASPPAAAAKPPPPPKPAATPAAPPPAAAVSSMDDFFSGGAAPTPVAPRPPPASAAPPPPPASPAGDFDFFSGGPAAAASTPIAQANNFGSLDDLGSIGGSTMKKQASSDPMENMMNWGSATPAAAQYANARPPPAGRAEPDLFGSHVSSAQVAAVQQATAATLWANQDHEVIDENEPEERKELRRKRQQAARDRVAEALREKLEADAKQAAETEERHELMDSVGPKITAWAKNGRGNIRVYLSTVQDVLWEGNTWKPITMMDIVGPAQVKKAWMKVLVNIHPDKVQQRGGNLQQRFIADKVFHHMLEAYNGFASKEL